MRKHIAADRLLLLLDELNIRKHAVLLELLCQFRGRDGAAMKTSERNELEDEADEPVSQIGNIGVIRTPLSPNPKRTI